MLRNVRLSSQITAGFGMLVLVLLGLGVYVWSALGDVDDAMTELEESGLIVTDATRLEYGVAVAGVTIERFLQGTPGVTVQSIVDAMQTVASRAQALADRGVTAAEPLVGLKARHIDEVNAFGAIHAQRQDLAAQAQTLGIEHRRTIGQLVGLLDPSDPALLLVASQASENFLLARVRIDRFLSQGAIEDFDSAMAPLDLTVASLDQLSRTVQGAEARDLVASARAGVAEFRAVTTDLREVELASRAALDVVRATTSEVEALLDVIVADSMSGTGALSQAAHAMISSMIQSIMIILPIATIFAAGVAMILGRSISIRLTRIVDQTRRLSEGDLDIEITGTEGRNDLAQMARALVTFRANAQERIAQEEAARDSREATLALQARQAAIQGRVVRDIGEGLSRLAEGDTSRQIDSPAHDPFPAEYESLRATFNALTQSLSAILTRISGLSEEVRHGTADITDAAGNLSTRAETQAATLEQSAAALNELTESVRRSADQARTAERLSQENRTMAEQGSRVVQEAVAAMSNIRKSSDRIKTIISVIEDIAFQTNLLALNAGVEAARSGDAGRGFAVVASEVRSLAKRASDSASEIRELILQSAAQVESGSGLVERTGDSLGQMLEKAQEISVELGRIAQSATEQSRGLGEVNAAVNLLDQVTQQNAAVAEETSAAASSLQQQAEQLRLAMGAFRVETGAGSGGRSDPRRAA